MNEDEQAELQAADLKFYPELGIRTRESRDAHLITASGKIYRGIRVWRREVKMPSFVVLLNHPEIRERQMSLSAATQKRLIGRIKDKMFDAAAGLA